MSDRRPNFVYVFADEFRRQAMGFMGEDPVVTPNLDRFRRQSTFLSHASATRPVCSPYRAMLFSGQYPFTNGVVGNCNSNTTPNGCYLKEDARCFGDVLKDRGYSLGYIGKLHLDPVPTEPPYDHGEGPRAGGVVWDAFCPPGPRRHGFDFWYSYGCCDKHMNPHYWTGDGPAEDVIDVHEWSTKHETDVAIEFLKNTEGRHRDADRPFGLVVSYNPPHMPFNGEHPSELLEHYADKTDEELLCRPNVDMDSEEGQFALKNVRGYFAMVTGVDEQFGRILDTLDELGLADDTIVIFTADHGEMMGSHKRRLGKSIWWDESLRVPFLVRWPGHIAAGATDDLLIGAPDIHPTLLGLCGESQHVPPQVQGIDYSAALRGEPCDRPTSSLYLWPRGGTAMDTTAADYRGVRSHRYTFIVERHEDGTEHLHLYDSVEDPYQMRNVADERAEVVEEHRAMLSGWLERTDDPWGGSL